MDLITEFIARYRKEYDFYEQACRIVAQILDSNLQSAGIRAMVTSRAKNPARLEAKVRQRQQSSDYKSVNEIYDDIVDLAGVRVALYFPGERDEVGKIIQRLFNLVDDPKKFPAAEPRTDSYKKRFSGYWATHYRVRMLDGNLNESQKRYIDAKVEIQVASVLMHAWSEVEHDLVYKPMQGSLSEDEYAILDELNGLVLAGEIALERLQRAGESRVSTSGREYANHYDLAASLLDLARGTLSNAELGDAAIGRVDVLYRLLKGTGLNTPEQLARYVTSLHSDFEKRPLAEQIIDQILTEDPNRYSVHENIRLLDSNNFSTSTEISRVFQNREINEFIGLWIAFEKQLRAFDARSGNGTPVIQPMRLLGSLNYPKNVIDSANRLRHFRNNLVHGIDVPNAENLAAATAELKALLIALKPPSKAPVAIKSKTKRFPKT